MSMYCDLCNSCLLEITQSLSPGPCLVFQVTEGKLRLPSNMFLRRSHADPRNCVCGYMRSTAIWEYKQNPVVSMNRFSVILS